MNLTIDDILNDKTPAVQSLKKAEAEIKEKKIAEGKAAKFESKGRPKIADELRQKQRSFTLSDEEKAKIEKIAELNGMSINEFIKFCVTKELRKEGVKL